MTTGPAVDLVALYLAELAKVEGFPYCWPDPSNGYSGKGLPGSKFLETRDCSGTVTAALHAAGGPDWRATHNAARLWADLSPVYEPQPGDLCFYGALRVTHVMTLMHDGSVFGASGGDSHTLNPTLAAEVGACVKKFAKGPTYRKDLVGFRSNPLRSL